MLLQLTNRECHYPLKYDPNVEGSYWFCAAPTEIDEVYCAKHHAACCIAPPQRRGPQPALVLRRMGKIR